MNWFMQMFKNLWEVLRKHPYTSISFVAIFILALIAFCFDKTIFTSTAIGALSGAAVVFYLSIFHSKEEQRSKNTAILVETKYCINKILRANDRLRKHIDKYKNRNGDLYGWEKITEYDAPLFLPNINTKNLLFLLKYDKEGEETLDSILLVNAENQEIARTLEKRNEYYFSYLKKTEDWKRKNKDELEGEIGALLFHRLKVYTDRLIYINNNISAYCIKAKNKINVFLNKSNNIEELVMYGISDKKYTERLNVKYQEISQEELFSGAINSDLKDTRVVMTTNQTGYHVVDSTGNEPKNQSYKGILSRAVNELNKELEEALRNKD